MKCVICGKPSLLEWIPFCGKGCKDIDLLRWMNENYSIPGSPISTEYTLESDEDDAEN